MDSDRYFGSQSYKQSGLNLLQQPSTQPSSFSFKHDHKATSRSPLLQEAPPRNHQHRRLLRSLCSQFPRSLRLPPKPKVASPGESARSQSFRAITLASHHPADIRWQHCRIWNWSPRFFLLPHPCIHWWSDGGILPSRLLIWARPTEHCSFSQASHG